MAFTATVVGEEELLRPSADEAAALFLTLPAESLAIIAWPGSVFCGASCDWRRVNWDYCAEHDIPVIRTVVEGAAYYYREGDALYVALVTSERHTQREVLDAMCHALLPDVPGLFVEDNDLRLGASRVGMAAPELRRQDGSWLNVVEVLLHSDLDEARQALAFPDGVWDHKPVSCLEDWIKPLDSVLGEMAEPIALAAIRTAAEALTGVTLG